MHQQPLIIITPRRALVAAIALLALGGLALAQTTITTGPISTDDNVEYVLTDVTTVAAAQGTEARIRVDATTGPFSVVTGPTCAVSTTPAGYRCVAKIPATVVSAVNVRGTHQIRVYAFSGGVESPSDTPFSITTGPAAPTGSRFTR